MTARKIFRSWSDTTVTYQVIRNQDTVSLTLNLKKHLPFMKTKPNCGMDGITG